MVVFNYLICIDINMKRIIMIIFILMVFIEAPDSNDENEINEYKIVLEQAAAKPCTLKKSLDINRVTLI